MHADGLIARIVRHPSDGLHVDGAGDDVVCAVRAHLVRAHGRAAFEVSGGGAWSNITATVAETDIPAGVTDAAKAYRFTLARPDGGSAFFRVVDNSSGASGSGLWWIVFGGISVDGQRGKSGMVGDHRFVGGILVEPEPLGGL